MAVRVREAKRGDFKQVRRMIQELAHFEKQPDAADGPKLSEEDLERDAFDRNAPLFYCLVAEDISDSSNLLGYTIYFYSYSTWQGRRMHLRDIYVSPACRGQGVGDALFKEVVQKAVERKCCSLDWIVLNWNPAQKFYKQRGAIDLTHTEMWHLFRTGPESMQHFASNTTDFSLTSAESSKNKDQIMVEK